MAPVKEREGTFLCYKPHNFNKESLRTLEVVNKIVHDYGKQGFDMTIRQIHYRLVKDNFYANDDKNYSSLKGLVNTGRLAGLVSWTAIVDRGRRLRGHTTWNAPHEAIMSVFHNYRIDKWADQPVRIVIRVEKQALEGVVGQICDKLCVDFLATKGYNSQSVEWREAQRFAHYIQQGQRPMIGYLGDHDASGQDMTRDCRERMAMFTGQAINVVRLGLNMNQIEELRLPPNPGKTTDSRKEQYFADYGTRDTWELDAAEPAYIQKLIEDFVMSFRDEALWDKALAREVMDKRMIRQAAETMGAPPEEAEEAEDDDYDEGLPED